MRLQVKNRLDVFYSFASPVTVGTWWRGRLYNKFGIRVDTVGRMGSKNTPRKELSAGFR